MANLQAENKNLTKSPGRRSWVVACAPGRGAWFSAVILLIVVFISWLALSRIRERINHDVENEMQTILHTVHAVTRSWIHDRLDMTMLLAERPDVRRLTGELLGLSGSREALVASPALAELREIVTPWLGRHDELDFFVIDGSGRNIAALDDQPLGQANFFFGQGVYLTEILHGSREFLPPFECEATVCPLPSADGGRVASPHVFVGVPITDQRGVIIAVLVIQVNPDQEMTRIVKMAWQGRSGDCYAFNKAGGQISMARFRPDFGGGVAQGAMVGTAGINLAGYPDYRGVPVVGAWLWDETYEFGMAYEVDVADVFRTYNMIRWAMIIVLAVTGLLCAVFVRWLVVGKHQVEAINRQLGLEVESRRKSEERFRVLLESSPDGILFVNLRGEIIMANLQIEKLFGYDRAELLMQPVEALIPGRVAEVHRQNRAAYFRAPQVREMNQRPGAADFYGLHKDGHEFPVEVGLSPVADADGVAVIASIRDISFRKRFVAELEESRAKFRRLVENLEDKYFFYAFGQDGIFTYLSPSFRTIVGYEPEESLVHYSEILADDPVNRQVQALIDLTLQGEKQPPFMLAVAHKDGNTRFIEVNNTPVLDASGKVLAVEGIANDVTEQVLAEVDQVRRTEQIISHKLALQRLARLDFASLKSALEKISEEAAYALKAERVGIWLFDSREPVMVCHDLYQLSIGGHESGAVIKLADCPIYFSSFGARRLLVADDVRNNKYTTELLGDYLQPLGITSMLDAGIFSQARLVGVVCVEHVGPARKWSDEEQTFTASVADLVTLAVEAHTRFRTQAELQQHRDGLELLVSERTRELRESEEKLRSITASVQVAIIMIDNGGVISFWNRSAERIFGWTATQALDRKPDSLVVPERYRVLCRELFHDFVQTGNQQYFNRVIEGVALRKDDGEFPVELALSAVSLQGKRHLLALVSDISERKRAAEELHGNMRDLERFSKLAVDRELQMISLKEEINGLLVKAGRPPRYRIVQ